METLFSWTRFRWRARRRHILRVGPSCVSAPASAPLAPQPATHQPSNPNGKRGSPRREPQRRREKVRPQHGGHGNIRTLSECVKREKTAPHRDYVLRWTCSVGKAVVQLRVNPDLCRLPVEGGGSVISKPCAPQLTPAKNPTEPLYAGTAESRMA